MNFKIIQPPLQLTDHVRFFWFLEGNASIDNPFVHHAFAYSCPELIFCYKGQFKYMSESEKEQTLSPGIYGQTHTFSKVASNADFGIFACYLYPQAFMQLFGIPANELTNHYADMKMLCGNDGEILQEKIMLAPDNNERVKLVSNFLEARLKNIHTEYSKTLSFIKIISETQPITSVKTLADDHFLSLRQFERRFKELSGFNPKLFLRIMRFNSLLNKPFQNKPLVQIAYDYGYYDQSHFIHDFQKFSGYSPKDYFKPETIAATDRGTIEFKK